MPLKTGKESKMKKLTLAETKYIDLMLKSFSGPVHGYEELFLRLAAELNLSDKLIRDYADKKGLTVVDEQLPPEPAVPIKELTNSQKFIRSIATPKKDATGEDILPSRRVTIMTDALSDFVENNAASPIRGSTRNKGCVFRQ